MINEFLESIRGVATDIIDVDERKAYACGYDCGKNGPNIHNCNFSLFTKQSWTKAWERGVKYGELSQKTLYI